MTRQRSTGQLTLLAAVVLLVAWIGTAAGISAGLLLWRTIATAAGLHLCP